MFKKLILLSFLLCSCETSTEKIKYQDKNPVTMKQEKELCKKQPDSIFCKET